MKKIGLILITVSVLSFIALPAPLAAQEKSKEEKEREMRMQQELEAQKKVLEEQHKAQEEAMKEVQKAMEGKEDMINDALKKAQEQIESADRYRDMVRVYRGTGDRDRSYFNGQPFVVTPGMEGFNWYIAGSDNERTTWDFSKSVKESSFSRDYTFDVEPTVNNVMMSVNGDCKSGEIRIKIVMPNGKVYSDITIDEFGNLNWRKSFKISEEENKDKAGAWKFQINASKATGYFKISLQTY